MLIHFSVFAYSYLQIYVRKELLIFGYSPHDYLTSLYSCFTISDAVLKSTALTLASAMRPATQRGSQAKSEIYGKFSFNTFAAKSFFDEYEKTFTNDHFELFKTYLLAYTQSTLVLTKGEKVTKKKVTKKNDLAEAGHVNKEGEVADYQPCSRELLIKLTDTYIVDERKGAEYSEPMEYNAQYDGIPYSGVADHSIKAVGIRAFILVWEDKIDLSTTPLHNRAVNQTALEILGEVSRLRIGDYTIPEKYCGILTSGTDWILVSYLCRRDSWRHSEMVSTVAEGVIAEVARLLAYALVCANAVLGLVKNATPFSHRLPSHKESDDGEDGNISEESHDGDDKNDEEDKISHYLLERSNISKPTNNGAVGSCRNGGSGKKTNDGENSGKRSSLSDCGRYQTLTSKLLRDRENIRPNKFFFELNKAASSFFFKN